MGWIHGYFEMFCMYRSSKDKMVEYSRIVEDDNGEFLLDSDGNLVFESTGIKPNPCYVDAERPEFCKKAYSDKDIENGELDMTPHPDCWMNDCKFLATSPVTPKEAAIMETAWEKAMKRGEFDSLESDELSDGGDEES